MERHSYELAEVPLTEQGSLPTQTKLAILHGSYHLCVFPLVTHSFAASTRHIIAVRLYRPRFETVTIRSWETPDKVIWKPALDLLAQEKALDNLLGIQNTYYYLGGKNEEGKEWWYSSFDEIPDFRNMTSTSIIRERIVLEPGSKSAAHREALLFAAWEYERLADKVRSPSAEEEKVCNRMREKANRLKSRAED